MEAFNVLSPVLICDYLKLEKTETVVKILGEEKAAKVETLMLFSTKTASGFQKQPFILPRNIAL